MNDRLEAYLSGSLTPEQSRDFERQLQAESPALLRAVRALRATPAAPPDAEPGPWFTDSVLAKWDARKVPLGRRVRDLLLTPRRIQVRPLTALVAAAVSGLAVTALLRTPAAPPAIIRPAAVQVVLKLHAPEAASVHAVGDFNAWSREATPLVPAAGGEWVARVELEPGLYQYTFLVDGKTFVVDPQAVEKVDDGFGNVNAVLKL